MFALGATLIFGDRLPQHFGNPIVSIYTLFRVFTVEGWYEIPDLLLSETSSSAWVFLVRGYFTASVLIGGILGLSLANAVFVDEMTVDNTKDLEAMVGELRRDVAGLRQELRTRGS
jgi:voltage-gated sodium channel